MTYIKQGIRFTSKRKGKSGKEGILNGVNEMKVRIRYYEQSYETGIEFAFEEIIDCEDLEQAEIEANYNCLDQDFDRYEVKILTK